MNSNIIKILIILAAWFTAFDAMSSFTISNKLPYTVIYKLILKGRLQLPRSGYLGTDQISNIETSDCLTSLRIEFSDPQGTYQGKDQPKNWSALVEPPLCSNAAINIQMGENNQITPVIEKQP